MRRVVMTLLMTHVRLLATCSYKNDLKRRCNCWGCSDERCILSFSGPLAHFDPKAKRRAGVSMRGFHATAAASRQQLVAPRALEGVGS